MGIRRLWRLMKPLFIYQGGSEDAKDCAGNWKMFNGPAATARFMSDFVPETDAGCRYLKYRQGIDGSRNICPFVSLSAASVGKGALISS